MKVLEQVHDGGGDDDGDEDDDGCVGGFRAEEKEKGMMMWRVNVVRLKKDGLA